MTREYGREVLLGVSRVLSKNAGIAQVVVFGDYDLVEALPDPGVEIRPAPVTTTG